MGGVDTDAAPSLSSDSPWAPGGEVVRNALWYLRDLWALSQAWASVVGRMLAPGSVDQAGRVPREG